MNLKFEHLIDSVFPGSSRVWIYQCSRLFSIQEALLVEEQLEKFIKEWQSHGNKVTAGGYLFFGQFIVLIADETEVAVSGCSTDSSVRFIKSLEQLFNVSFFDRQSIAFVIKNAVQLLPLPQVGYALDNGFISADTLMFNNTVLTLDTLKNNWIIPVKNSWLAKKIIKPAI